MSREIIYTGVVANDGSGDTLRLAMSKVNNNFSELFTQYTDISRKTSNTWTSPQTSNTYSVVQVAGATRVVLPQQNTTVVSSTLTRPVVDDFQIYLSRNTELDDALFPILNQNVETPTITITVGANISEGSIVTYNNTEWFLTLTNGPFTLSQGATANVRLIYPSEPQPWFDPQALGYTNFRAAKLAYRAYIDKFNGYNEVGEIFYTASDDNVNYETLQNKAKSKNTTQNVDLNVRRSTDKLHYKNTSSPAGNLHIQWSGTVWTGQDK